MEPSAHTFSIVMRGPILLTKSSTLRTSSTSHFPFCDPLLSFSFFIAPTKDYH